MRFLAIMATIITAYSSQGYAGYSYPVEAVQSVYYGPFINKGDLSYLEQVVEMALKELEEKCSGEDRRLSGKEKIDYLSVGDNAVRSLEIRVTDTCYII